MMSRLIAMVKAITLASSCELQPCPRSLIPTLSSWEWELMALREAQL